MLCSLKYVFELVHIKTVKVSRDIYHTYTLVPQPLTLLIAAIPDWIISRIKH